MSKEKGERKVVSFARIRPEIPDTPYRLLDPKIFSEKISRDGGYMQPERRLFLGEPKKTSTDKREGET